MNDKTGGGVRWIFWIIATVALIWNALGAVNFFVQMNPDVVAAYRDSERAIIVDRPVWATGGFAVAVFGGTLGGLLLLLRKRSAYPVFVASLLGVVVTMAHSIRVAVDFSFGPLQILGVILMPLVVAAFFVWYSRRAARKGWLG